MLEWLVRLAIIAALPFTVFMLFRLYFNVIEPYRKRTGYLVNTTSHGGFSVEYYEGDKELHFFSDDCHFQIPNESLWDQTMPDFFKGRQPLIVKRLRYYLPSRYSFEFVDAYPEDHSVLYVDDSKSGGERAVQIPLDRKS